MLNKLTTESRNPASEDLDQLSAFEIVQLMNAEDAQVSVAVGKETQAIARAVEMIAERLLDKCLLYLGIDPGTLDFDMDEDNEEFWSLLTPKTAIDFMKTLTQLQRVSVGLPAGGPLPAGPNQSANGLASMEVILRTLHHENVDPQLQDVSVTNDDGEKVTAELLQDPVALQTAQELIIRLSSNGAAND